MRRYFQVTLKETLVYVNKKYIHINTGIMHFYSKVGTKSAKNKLNRCFVTFLEFKSIIDKTKKIFTV